MCYGPSVFVLDTPGSSEAIASLGSQQGSGSVPDIRHIDACSSSVKLHHHTPGAAWRLQAGYRSDPWDRHGVLRCCSSSSQILSC